MDELTKEDAAFPNGVVGVGLKLVWLLVALLLRNIRNSCIVADVVAVTLLPVEPPAVAPDVWFQRMINVLVFAEFVKVHKHFSSTEPFGPIVPAGILIAAKLVSFVVPVTDAAPALATTVNGGDPLDICCA